MNVQCHQYWPTKVGTSQTFDYIEVHNVDEEDFVAGQVVLRYLNLKSKFILQIDKKSPLTTFYLGGILRVFLISRFSSNVRLPVVACFARKYIKNRKKKIREIKK